MCWVSLLSPKRWSAVSRVPLSLLNKTGPLPIKQPLTQLIGHRSGYSTPHRIPTPHPPPPPTQRSLGERCLEPPFKTTSPSRGCLVSGWGPVNCFNGVLMQIQSPALPSPAGIKHRPPLPSALSPHLIPAPILSLCSSKTSTSSP